MKTSDIQSRLNALGFPCKIDGWPGSKTQATVKAFQASRGLFVDGIVGPQTEAALWGASQVHARKTSPAGIKALANREGRRLKAYQDSVGVWTVGIGHTTAAGPPTVMEGMTITDAECDAIFAHDLAKYEATVNEVVKRPISQNAFDACVSLCYNIGQGGFAGSTVVKRINAGDMYGAGEAFMLWNQPYEILGRRAGERMQFLKPDAPGAAFADIPPPPDYVTPPHVAAPYDPPLPGQPGYVPPAKPSGGAAPAVAIAAGTLGLGSLAVYFAKWMGWM